MIFETMIDSNQAKKTTPVLITLIDDEEVGHFIFQKIARNVPGLQTATYLDANVVINLIKHNKFNTDVILLDINMPFMDGWDFLNELEPLNFHKPIFIVSSSASPKDVEKSKCYKDVKGFYSKPLLVSDLLMIIDSLGMN